MTLKEINETYGKANVKFLHGKAVVSQKPTHDGNGGWIAKFRVCICGNGEEGTRGHDDENRAEVPSTCEMKTLLTLGQEKDWKVGALDVKAAFLHAELDDKADGIYAMKPPAVLVRHKFEAEGTYWKLNKVLYGLRQGPKRWSEHRDRVLGTMEVWVDDGETETDSMATASTDEADVEPRVPKKRLCIFVQVPQSKNIWLIKDKETGEIVGRLMVYVDDVLISGPKEVVLATFQAFESQWECKISGILGETDVPSLNFLGMTIALMDGTLIIHQKDYILSKLRKMGILSGRGRQSLPDVSEGKTPPVPLEARTSKEYLKVLRICQEQTGTLRWLAMKSRPDIEAAVSICASLQTHEPK